VAIGDYTQFEKSVVDFANGNKLLSTT
jgi:hypothetical protein